MRMVTAIQSLNYLLVRPCQMLAVHWRQFVYPCAAINVQSTIFFSVL